MNTDLDAAIPVMSVIIVYCVVVKAGISIMLAILYIVGYDGRRTELSNAPLDRRYDNYDIMTS